jgi:hypothetical protein
MFKLSLAFFFFSFLSFSQIIFEDSFSDALKKAKTENKLLFIKYYNANCPVCMALVPFLESKEMGDFYNKHFVSYKLNTFEITPEEELFIENSGLKFKSVPFFLFFDGEGKFVHHSSTQKDLEYLIGIGKSALNTFSRSSNLADLYEKGDRTVRTLYAYCTLLHLYEEDSLIKVVANDLFEAFDPSELATKKSYIITKKCVNHSENGFFKFWVENMKLMEEVGGCEHGEHRGIMQRILLNTLEKDDFENLDDIEQLKKYIIQTELSENPEVFLWRQEARLLLESGEESKAFNLIMRKADEGRKNVAAVLYPIEYGFKILKSESSLKGLNFKLDQLDINNVSAREQLKWNFLKYLYYQKINKEDASANHIEQIKVIAKENAFTNEDVNSFLKIELLK